MLHEVESVGWWLVAHSRRPSPTSQPPEHLIVLNPESERTDNRFELIAISHCMQVEINEIVGWAGLDVSWAVLGFAGTGTTFLVMNSHGHPDLEFIYEPEQ